MKRDAQRAVGKAEGAHDKPDASTTGGGAGGGHEDQKRTTGAPFSSRINVMLRGSRSPTRGAMLTASRGTALQLGCHRLTRRPPLEITGLVGRRRRGDKGGGERRGGPPLVVTHRRRVGRCCSAAGACSTTARRGQEQLLSTPTSCLRERAGNHWRTPPRAHRLIRPLARKGPPRGPMERGMERMARG